MTHTNVAVVQMRPVEGNPSGNVQRFAELARTRAAGDDLIVGPEYLTCGFKGSKSEHYAREIAEPLDGPTVEAAAKLAREMNASIIFGMLERAGDSVHNTAIVALPDGNLHTHRKTHMYPEEASILEVGDELSVVTTPVGTIGVMICFEHAFPEIASSLARRGAEILVVPTGVTPDNPYVHILSARAQTRAQDNQVHLVLCNCINSLIVDPRGKVVAAAGSEETVLRAAIDLDAVGEERMRRPMSQLRRPSVMSDIDE